MLLENEITLQKVLNDKEQEVVELNQFGLNDDKLL
jgi:hypothetical protein